MALAAQGRITPVVDRVFALAEWSRRLSPCAGASRWGGICWRFNDAESR